MRILVDTNILLRAVQHSHPLCRTARMAIRSFHRDGYRVFLTLQNLAEFWNVCTRPTNVSGMGLWRRLVVTHAVRGVQVHDARLIAVMETYAIQRIATFNAGDFARYPGIEVVHPADVAALS